MIDLSRRGFLGAVAALMATAGLSFALVSLRATAGECVWDASVANFRRTAGESGDSARILRADDVPGCCAGEERQGRS